jgi:hypothetical protein
MVKKEKTAQMKESRVRVEEEGCKVSKKKRQMRRDGRWQDNRQQPGKEPKGPGMGTGKCEPRVRMEIGELQCEVQLLSGSAQWQ